MVVQKSWNNVEASHQNTAPENSSNSTWNFQAPAKAVVNVRGTVTTNVPVVSSLLIRIIYIRHKSSKVDLPFAMRYPYFVYLLPK